jgi:hypothetical protein
MKGHIAYTAPSVMTLLNKEYTDFDGLSAPNGSSQKMAFEVSVFSGTTELKCHHDDTTTETPCDLNYSRSFTPLLLDTTPANVYFDQLMQFNVNAKSAYEVAAADLPITQMKIGGANLDYEDHMSNETRLPKW